MGVRSARRRLGIESQLAQVYAHRTDVDWANVDWTKSNTELAKLLGMHPKNVGIRRRRMGASNPPRARTAKTRVVRIKLPIDLADWVDSVELSQVVSALREWQERK
jgi:hypothetical protein